MVDMTMCRGKGCPMAKYCYRAIAKANPQYQSYFVTTPIKEGDINCEHYISVREDKLSDLDCMSQQRLAEIYEEGYESVEEWIEYKEARTYKTIFNYIKDFFKLLKLLRLRSKW